MMVLRWLFLTFTAITLISAIQQIYLARTLLDPNRRKQAALSAALLGSSIWFWIPLDILPSVDVVLKALLVELVAVGVWTLWIPPDLAMERCRGLPQYQIFLWAFTIFRGGLAFACTSLGLAGLFLLIFSPDSTSAVFMGLFGLGALTLLGGSILVLAMMVATNTAHNLQTNAEHAEDHDG
jgi:hypothetical protein